MSRFRALLSAFPGFRKITRFHSVVRLSAAKVGQGKSCLLPCNIGSSATRTCFGKAARSLTVVRLLARSNCLSMSKKRSSFQHRVCLLPSVSLDALQQRNASGRQEINRAAVLSVRLHLHADARVVFPTAVKGAGFCFVVSVIQIIPPSWRALM